MKTVPKKLLSLTAAVMMLANALPASVLSAAAADTAQRGDVNGDGKIDSKDREDLVTLLGSTCETLFSEGDRLPYDISGDGFIDPRDLYALDGYLSDGTPFPETAGTRIDDSVTLSLSGGECLPGETVTLDLSVIDWTKDITGFEIMVYFDSRAFDFEEASYFSAEGITVCEGEGIKLTGLFGDQSLWRGKLAALTFKAKGSAAGSYEFAIRGGNLYNSEYDVYNSVKDTSAVEVADLFAPVGLECIGITGKSAELQWEMPFADQPITGYRIYRDGKQVGKTADLSYIDKKLEPDTDYVYTVRAVTTAGELTSETLPVTVHTAAPKIESVKFPADVITDRNSDLTVLLEQKMRLSEMKLTFTAEDGTASDASVDLSGISAQRVDYHWDLAEVKGGTYTVKAVITDADGLTDSAETEVTVHTEAPAPVTVNAFAGSRSVTLTWSIAQEATAAGYRVYQKTGKDGKFELAAEIADRSRLDTVIKGLTAGTTYYFAVTAYDIYGAESEMSEAVSAVPDPDTGSPEVTYFIPKTGTRAAGELKIEIRATDDSAVTKIVCEIAPQPEEGAEPQWTPLFEQEDSVLRAVLNTKEQTDGIYQLRAMAYDADGNASSGENIAVIQIDNTAPAQVENLRTEAIYPTQATLAWDNVPDEDFSYFRVIISHGSSVETRTVRDTLGLNLSGLTPETLYSVTVCAADLAGNFGAESAPLRFFTTEDKTAPVITGFTVSSDAVRPDSYLTVWVTATDTAAVTKRYLQYSQDQKEWKTLTLTDLTRSFSLYTSGMTEGELYLRAYATDYYGNTGNPEDAVIQTIIVDATAPEAVTDLTANILNGGVSLSWNASASEDAFRYRLDRAEGSPDNGFTTLFDKDSRTDFYDTTAEYDKKYYYRVYAYDKAWNISEASELLEVVRESDNIAPVFSQGTITGTAVCEATHVFQVIVEDNVKVAEASLSYRLDDAETVYALTAKQEVNSDGSQMHLTAELPESVYAAEKITITVQAKDTAGNAAEPKDYVFAVDNSKADLSGIKVGVEGNNVSVKWKAAGTEKTRSMFVYRKIDDGPDEAVASVTPDNSGDGNYSFLDRKITKTGVYVYRIVAVQNSGNSVSLSAEPREIHAVPQAKLVCDTAQVLGAAYRFDATGSLNPEDITKITLDYGDGTVAAAESVEKAVFEHTYAEIGEYDAVLTCSNADGASGTCTVKITVSAPSDVAEVTVRVTATDGSAASYAAVYVDFGTPYQMKYETDESGTVSFTATSGDHEIGVFGTGYLPTAKTCNFVAGTKNEIPFSVVVNQLVDASFQVKRMTLDEIEAAGINVADPANSHVVQINVQASYQSSTSQKKDKLSIVYDFTSGKHVVKSDDDNRYKYSVAAVKTKKKEIETVVLLRIPAEVSFLKEFFNVEMVIINNASREFSIEDASVSLNYPSGLTLMDNAYGSDSQTEYLGTVAGGSTRTLNWILRGDVRGSYWISADFEGTLAGFDEHISQRFTCDQAIEVRGREAAEIHVNIDSAIRSGGLMVEMLVNNPSDIPLYNVSTELGTPLVEALKKFSGTANVTLSQTRFTGRDGILRVLEEKTNSIEELNPGESFSVLYRITGFSREYAFTLLNYLKNTLKFSADSGNVHVCVTSNVRYVNTKSLFYGIRFDQNTQYMLAFRNKAGKELSGVNVRMYQFVRAERVNEITGTTDERGRLIIDRQSADETYILRAEQPGYEEYYDAGFTFPSRRSKYYETIVMDGDVDAGDYGLRTARLYLNGRFKSGLLIDHASVRRDSNDTIEIRATTRSQAKKFELWQGDRRLDNVNMSGTSVTFEGLRAYNFTIGKNIFVRVYTETGDYVDTPLNLEISRSAASAGASAAQELAQEVNEQNNKQPITLTNPEWSGQVGMDMTFSLPDFANIGNMPSSDDADEIAEKTGLDIEIKETGISVKISHSIEIPLKGKDAGQVKLDKPKKEGGAQVSHGEVIYIVAYFQLSLEEDPDKNTFQVDGTLGVEFGGRAETVVFWTATPIPFYFSLTFELGGEVSRHLTYTYDFGQSSSELEYHVDGSGHASIRPMLAIGQSDIAHIGIYGEAKLQVDGVLFTTSSDGPHFTKVELSGKVGFEADILGWWGWDFAFLEGSCVLYDYEENKRRAQGRPRLAHVFEDAKTDDGQTVAAAVSDPANYTPMTEADFAEAGAWNGSSSVLQEGVHISASPVLVSDGNTILLVWLAKDVSRGVPNASYAVFSVYDSANKCWSEPKAVDSNQNADLSPVLFADASGICIAYQESSAVYENSDVTIEDYAKGMVITAARFDAEKQAFTGFAQIRPRTEGAYVASPVFTAEDGTVKLIYTENTSGRIFGDDSTNAILCADFTAEGLSEPAVLAENKTAITGLAAGTKDGKAVIAAVTDDNSDFSDYYDRTLTVFGLDGEGTVLAEGRISAPQFSEIPGSGKAGLIWYQDGSLYASDDLAKASLLLDGTELFLTDRFLADGDRLLVTEATENGNALCAAVWNADAERFESPVVLTAEDGTYLEHLTKAENGTETVYAAVKSTAAVTDEGVQLDSALVSAAVPEKHDLTLEKAECDYTAAEAGKALPLTLTVRNAGTDVMNGITVTLTDADGVQAAAETVETVLHPGESAVITASPVLAETFAAGKYTVAAVSGDSDANPDDNSAELDLSVTDLVLAMEREFIGDTTSVMIAVTNESNVPSAALVHICPQGAEEDTLTLLSEEIEPHQTAIWIVDSADMLGDIYHGFVRVSVEADQADRNEQNNAGWIVLSQSGFDPANPGDVDLDGDVDAADALLVLRICNLLMLETEPDEMPYSTTQQKAADVRGTGSVSAVDALMILRYANFRLLEDDSDISIREYINNLNNGGTQS